MLRQPLPPSAADYARVQRREITDAVAAVRRQWRRMGTDLDASWTRVQPTMLAITTTAQHRLATGAQGYVPAVLEDTGQTRALAAAGEASILPLLGVAGDGRPVDTLLYGAVVHARTEIGAGATTYQAMHSASRWLSMTTSTLLSDTARQSETLAIGVRPVTYYVRMLTPPSCSRCVLLAGRRYRAQTAFQRHPHCDCRHIPASESVAGDLTVSPRAYFDSLTAEQQAKIFGVAGSEAIRSGADINQVVNARRGMTRSQSGRLARDASGQYTTTEGTTRRGYAYLRLSQGRADDVRRPGSRYRSARPPRLMPESIAEIAGTDRDLRLRLLRTHGYLL